MYKKNKLSSEQQTLLLDILEKRFQKNGHRHDGVLWNDVVKRLQEQPGACWSLNEMEESGGEPDVIVLDKSSDKIVFCDFSKETPKGRRSLCYDNEALESRKDHKPRSSAVSEALKMGIKLLDEKQYFSLQALEKVDTKTSSWLLTPTETRSLGGALFGDHRFGRTFIYHNGAESYYGVRGFRGIIEV